MIVTDILNIIESAAPLEWQEAWDNSGLQVGSRNASVERVLLTVDVTESVVSEAIEKDCQLIISHHPLLFQGLKQITDATPQARIVRRAIEHKIAIYSTHTSMDSALHGVSGRMAEKIGIKDYRILVPHKQYGSEVGLGVIGELPDAMEMPDFIESIKHIFAAPWVRYTEGRGTKIKTVALCGGAGAEFMHDAIQQGADAFISADFKYHTMQEAADQIVLVDMDHWVSEHFTREIIAELLAGKVEYLIAETDRTPIKIL